jgi:hypothetical protein
MVRVYACLKFVGIRGNFVFLHSVVSHVSRVYFDKTVFCVQVLVYIYMLIKYDVKAAGQYVSSDEKCVFIVRFQRRLILHVIMYIDAVYISCTFGPANALNIWQSKKMVLALFECLIICVRLPVITAPARVHVDGPVANQFMAVISQELLPKSECQLPIGLHPNVAKIAWLGGVVTG